MAVAPLPGLDDVSLEGERLYRDHGRSVLAICVAILRNREEAEDAAQQVFVSAVRALRSGTTPRDAGAWLATIARRECWLRARAQPPTAELDCDAGSLGDDVSTAVVRREQISALWRAIDGLPETQREALLLREVRGLDYDELADGLKVSHASARSLLLRARRTVRRQLERGAGFLSGAPWLNVAARLFADGQNPTVGAAARTAAVGLGALAVTGGAVLAPDLGHHPAPAAHHAIAARHVVHATHSPSPPLVHVGARVVRPESPRVVHGPSSHEHRRESGGSDARPRGRVGERSGSSEGGARARGEDGGGTTPTATIGSGESGDGGSPGRSGPDGGDGSRGGGGSGGGSSGSGDSGGHDGGSGS